MKDRIIDEKIRLIPYYPCETALAWYQDPQLCKEVDNIDFVYDQKRLDAMYTYLSDHGDCYYIAYEGELIGDVSLQDNGKIAIVICRQYQNRHIGPKCINEMIRLAKEKGMEKVMADIYTFNTRSQNIFLNLGFKKTGTGSYEYLIEK